MHGEARHLREQARLGLASGIPHALVQKDGDVIRLGPGDAKKVGEERVGKLVLDGDVILPANGSTINERRKIAHQGVIAVSLVQDGAGRLVGAPVVRPIGVPVEEDRDDFIRDAADVAGRAVEPGVDPERLRENVRLAVRRCATLWTGKKPVVEVMIIRT